MKVSQQFAAVQWADALLPPMAVPPPLDVEAKKEFGGIPGVMGHLSPLSWLLRAGLRMANPYAYAPPEILSLIGFVVTQDNSCRYCYGTQRAYMRIMGQSEAQIERLEQDLEHTELDATATLALEYARKISRANPRPGAKERDALVAAGLSREAVAEIAVCASWWCFGNRLATLMAVPPDAMETVIERPLFKMIRPFVAWSIRRKPRPKPIKLERNEGQCAKVISALGDSPAATALRQIVDDAFASPVLPRKTKTMVSAVIGKALGCPTAEAEARVLLAGEGWSDADVTAMLTNLAHPKLDAREAVLVPFARETVRYQPPVTIQVRMREVTKGMTREETVEVAGIIGLANMLARLSVLPEAC
jgi:alkylhydroperoxidase family enzyme